MFNANICKISLQRIAFNWLVVNILQDVIFHTQMKPVQTLQAHCIAKLIFFISPSLENEYSSCT